MMGQILNRVELSQLPLKDYFKRVESGLDSSVTVDWLTGLFTDLPYEEKKPYLVRRQLQSTDDRFRNIEIVYDTDERVKAIVWNFRNWLSLTQLTEWFGEPIVYNEPYSNTTAFAFKSRNPAIEIIETRYSKWLEKSGSSKGFEMENEEGQKIKVSNPEFGFIQIKLL